MPFPRAKFPNRSCRPRRPGARSNPAPARHRRRPGARTPPARGARPLSRTQPARRRTAPPGATCSRHTHQSSVRNPPSPTRRRPPPFLLDVQASSSAIPVPAAAGAPVAARNHLRAPAAASCLISSLLLPGSISRSDLLLPYLLLPDSTPVAPPPCPESVAA